MTFWPRRVRMIDSMSGARWRVVFIFMFFPFGSPRQENMAVWGSPEVFRGWT
jgi:hypothetical protein